VTTENDFHNTIDNAPEDWHTRLVFADWLEDRDDPRAAGYRAIAIQQRRPLQGKHKGTNAWWWHRSFAGNDYYNIVPPDWFNLLPVDDGNMHFWPVFRVAGGIKSRRECEDALALAFSQLPPERQAELLTPPTPKAKK
jgi:uncharacterized protein (TIGR02996 family)